MVHARIQSTAQVNFLSLLLLLLFKEFGFELYYKDISNIPPCMPCVAGVSKASNV